MAYFFLKKVPSVMSTLMPLLLNSWCIHLSWFLRWYIFSLLQSNQGICVNGLWKAKLLDTGCGQPSDVVWVTEGIHEAMSMWRTDTGSGAPNTWGVPWFPEIEEVPGFVGLQFSPLWIQHEALQYARQQGCLRACGLRWGCMDDLIMA